MRSLGRFATGSVCVRGTAWLKQSAKTGRHPERSEGPHAGLGGITSVCATESSPRFGLSVGVVEFLYCVGSFDRPAAAQDDGEEHTKIQRFTVPKYQSTNFGSPTASGVVG